MRRSLIAASMVLAWLVTPNPVAAQDGDLQRQIAESRRRLEEIRAERERLQSELERARTGVRDVVGELQNIERQLGVSRSVLGELDLQLEIASRAAEQNTRSLVITRERHQEANAILHRRLRDIYKMGALHSVRVLLGADSFADLLNRYRYLHMIASYDRSLLRRVSALAEDLGSRNEELRSNRDDLGRLRQSKLVEVNQLRSVEGDHRSALEAFRDAEQETQGDLVSLEADEAGMQTLIDELETRRLELERARATISSSLSRADVGSLDWPIDGDIVYRFGLQRRPNGTVLRWNGVGITAPLGSPVSAVRGGTVVLAGPFEGYGPTVVLSHGGGFYTLYLYLEEVGVVEGRAVDTGQVVGTVGGADSPEGPHIEFQIRAPVDAGGSPQAQDPLDWLRPRG